MKDAYTIIHEELARWDGYKKVLGDTVMVQCPFHDDRTPSLGIYMVSGMEIPLGFFHCFGCGEKGHWNKFAEKVGLQTFKEFQVVEGSAHEFLGQLKKKEDKLLGERATTLKALMRQMGKPSYFEWDPSMTWRGFSGNIIKRVDGYYLVDRWKNGGDLMLFFPVKIGRKYYGGVRAVIEKRWGKTSYVNTGGDWANDYGLFPYEYTRKLLKKRNLDFVVLVEGPRDALRLLVNGIPALSVLGANNFSQIKMNLVLRLGVKHVYMMPDNDKGGALMAKGIKETFTEHNGILIPKKIGLPKEYNDKGELIKLDPMEAPKSLIKELRVNLKKTHKIKSLPRMKGYI